MNHDSYPDSYIRGILNTVKTIAMVGASAKENRPSYFAFKYLLERGYRMIPVNPGQAGQRMLGQTIYARLADIPEPIDMVDIFRASQYAPAIVQEALALKPRPQRDLDAARHAQRRGGGAGRGQWHESGDEPLSQDRIRQTVVGDRLDGRQYAHAVSSRKATLGGIQRMTLNRTSAQGGATEAADRAQREEAGG